MQFFLFFFQLKVESFKLKLKCLQYNYLNNFVFQAIINVKEVELFKVEVDIILQILIVVC